MVSFTDYLAAREPLDYESMDDATWHAFLKELRRSSRVRVLDLGCGTGALFRYMLEAVPALDAELLGIDLDPACVEAARAAMDKLVDSAGPASLAFRTADLLHEDLGDEPPFDMVCAKSFCDMVPLEGALQRMRDVLVEGGHLYAPINYNGRTSFAPAPPDREFERALLYRYDRSMDERTVDGLPVGGSDTGTEILGALAMQGFEIIAFGASDWCVCPLRGAYRRDEEIIATRAILETIHGEAMKHEQLDRSSLERWFSERLRQLDAGQLSMVIHHTDVLARKLPT